MPKSLILAVKWDTAPCTWKLHRRAAEFSELWSLLWRCCLISLSSIHTESPSIDSLSAGWQHHSYTLPASWALDAPMVFFFAGEFFSRRNKRYSLKNWHEKFHILWGDKCKKILGPEGLIIYFWVLFRKETCKWILIKWEYLIPIQGSP